MGFALGPEIGFTLVIEAFALEVESMVGVDLFCSLPLVFIRSSYAAVAAMVDTRNLHDPEYQIQIPWEDTLGFIGRKTNKPFFV